jgi:hypothetical protein
MGLRAARRGAPPSIFAPVGVILFCAFSASAQDPEVDVREGVPAQPVEASQGVMAVESAVRRVEEQLAEGLPADFTLEFGDTYDWIRLPSGEWLKGDLNWMREKDIEFDSEELGFLNKSWSDVHVLHSPNVNTYVFQDKVDVMGRAVVTKKEVIVETPQGVQVFPRSGLLSILKGGQRERDRWSMRFTAGFSGTAGNANQGALNTFFGLARADKFTLAGVDYNGSFGYAKGEQTVNRHLAHVGVLLFLSNRFYVIPAISEFFNDRFANIRFRATPAALGGVHIFDTKNADWDFEVGLGYQFIRFLSTEAGTENPQNDGFVALRTKWEFDITNDVELELDWNSNVVYTTIGLTYHRGSAVFGVEISDVFDFMTKFVFYRTENPPPRADGTRPEKNDYEIIVSLGVTLGSFARIP